MKGSPYPKSHVRLLTSNSLPYGRNFLQMGSCHSNSFTTILALILNPIVVTGLL
jgi:hypothetical protein